MQNLSVPVYGLHIPEPPQFVVLPPPPSAFTTVGVTKVLRNNTAVAMTSSIRFTVYLLIDCELDRDRYMAFPAPQRHRRTLNCSEFVTK